MEAKHQMSLNNQSYLPNYPQVEYQSNMCETLQHVLRLGFGDGKVI